jgi:hypothetical protein
VARFTEVGIAGSRLVVLGSRHELVHEVAVVRPPGVDARHADPEPRGVLEGYPGLWPGLRLVRNAPDRGVEDAVRVRKVEVHLAIGRVVTTCARAVLAECTNGVGARPGGLGGSRRLSLVAREKAQPQFRRVVERDEVKRSKSEIGLGRRNDEFRGIMRVRLENHARGKVVTDDAFDDIVARGERGKPVTGRYHVRRVARVHVERLPDRRRRQEVAVETDLERQVDRNPALEVADRAVEAGAIRRIRRDDAQRGTLARFELGRALGAPGERARQGQDCAQLSE